MTAALQIVALALSLGPTIAFGALGTENAGSATPPAPKFPEEVSSCAKCHRETHDEWKASTHHGSWTDSLVQERLKRLKKDSAACAKCHAAKLEFDGQGDVSATARQGGRELGVSCKTCHCTAECVMIGPRDIRSPHHPEQASSVFPNTRAEALCRTCHHNAERSFDARPAAMRDKSCVDCHMPVADPTRAAEAAGSADGPGRPRHRHTFLGSHDATFVASALRIEITPTGAVSATNVGAGHALPLAPVKTLIITMSALNDAGDTLDSRRIEIGHKNPIPPGGAWTGQAPTPDGTAELRVAITYRFADFQPASQHMTIATRSQKIR